MVISNPGTNSSGEGAYTFGSNSMCNRINVFTSTSLSGTYAAENGTDIYVAEDGVSPYVTET